jgi:hypothetical protein
MVSVASGLRMVHIPAPHVRSSMIVHYPWSSAADSAYMTKSSNTEIRTAYVVLDGTKTISDKGNPTSLTVTYEFIVWKRILKY